METESAPQQIKRRRRNRTKILVTGGHGFIGTRLVHELERRGHDTWACDIHNSNRQHYSRCDVREYRQIEKLFEIHNFDLMYHAAAEYGRWNGEDYYENLWSTNVVGTKNIVRLQEKSRFRMVLFSSAEVYGDYDQIMREAVMDEIPIKQMNDYAMSKWVNELQVLNSAEMFGTESVRIRPFNVYGPGEHYTPYRGVVPTFIYKALHNMPYTVYLEHKRTFEYVDDVCKTIANIADRFKPGEAYNIGNEPPIEIKHLSDLILQKLGIRDDAVTYKPAEPFTTKVKIPDSTKAVRDLGHRCSTPIREGISNTVNWMRDEYKIGIKASAMA